MAGALEYLQTHVPEDDLPASFRKSQPIPNQIKISNHQDSEALALSWKSTKLSDESGLPKERVEEEMKKWSGLEEGAIASLLRALGGDDLELDNWKQWMELKTKSGLPSREEMGLRRESEL
jgi:hypothetical protein